MVVCFAFLFLLSCATKSNIRTYNLENYVVMYFLPPTLWKAKDISAYVDFNYKSNSDAYVICNISVVKKDRMSRSVSNFVFYADSNEYKLLETRILRTSSIEKLVRVTSLLKQEDFLRIINAENVSLKLIADGVQYECFPSKDFNLLKREFTDNFSVTAN